MKTNSLSPYGFILAIFLITSCSPKNLMTLRVTEPAPVHLTSDIQHVGVINRSLPSKETKAVDKFDKILSVEGKNLDKEGAEKSITGLYDRLSTSGKFAEIKIIDDNKLKNPGLGVFPSAIDWSNVEKICNDNDLDALFVLSFYDTDAKISYDAVPIEIQGPAGIKVPAIEHHATISTLIKTGWRIYVPQGKIIADEYIINNSVTSKGVGINPAKAAEAIIGRKENVMEVSSRIGVDYALRVLPYNTRVSRYYYVRGTDNFKTGKRRAQTGNWDGAAELWEKEVSNPDPKIAGRACYNMAIINEINGDLDKAVEWASKAYADYNDKLALKYLNILKSRIRKNRLLEE